MTVPRSSWDNTPVTDQTATKKYLDLVTLAGQIAPVLLPGVELASIRLDNSCLAKVSVVARLGSGEWEGRFAVSRTGLDAGTVAAVEHCCRDLLNLKVRDLAIAAFGTLARDLAVAASSA